MIVVLPDPVDPTNPCVVRAGTWSDSPRSVGCEASG